MWVEVCNVVAMAQLPCRMIGLSVGSSIRHGNRHGQTGTGYTQGRQLGDSMR